MGNNSTRYIRNIAIIISVFTQLDVDVINLK